MAEKSIQDHADGLLEKAVSQQGARDPREACRVLLRELKARNREGYEQAVTHYEKSLLPAVAAGQAEPLAAWLDYARRLAGLIAPGRTVAVDAEGVARDCVPPISADRLVLHLPHEGVTAALVVALPATLSPAQQATYDLLVAGRVALES